MRSHDINLPNMQGHFRTLLHELMTGKVRVGEMANNN